MSLREEIQRVVDEGDAKGAIRLADNHRSIGYYALTRMVERADRDMADFEQLLYEGESQT